MNVIHTLLRSFVVAAISLSASLAHSADVVRIATEGAYPPFNYTESSGQLGGFDVDIAKALCAEMKVECEIVAQDWDGILPGLIANKYDAVIASMSITEERKKTVDFTKRYYSNHLRLVAKNGTNVSLKALRGKAVGAQRSTIAAQWLEDNLGRKAKIKLYDTQTAAYSDLKSGRLKAIVSDVYPAYDWTVNNPGYSLVGDKIEINDSIGIAVRKGDDELREAINKALSAIRDSGRYATINQKYFPFDIY